jgi:hypothetical protein
MASYFLNKLRGLSKVQAQSLCVMLPMFAIFLYGVVRFPDGPLRQCATGYCGKMGAPYTLSDFQAYNMWQLSWLVSWAIGAILLYFIKRQGMSK